MFGQWSGEDVWTSNHMQWDTEMDDYDAGETTSPR